MSEDHKMEFLEPKYNLCIAEDAFEKFQAVSMYEEKEYITLPQNVPPDPNGAHSDDNNVASSSASEFNNPVSSTMVCSDNIKPTNNSQSHLDADLRDRNNILDDSDMVVSNSENLNNQENTTVESITSDVRPRKRGRKPKKSPIILTNDQPADTSQSIQNPDISSTPFSSDPETPNIRNVRRSRGRPKRAITVEESSLALVTDRESSTGINNPDNQTGLPAAKRSRGGKRGRPRRSGGLSIERNAEVKEQAIIKHNQLNDNKVLDDLDCAQVKVSNRVSDKGNKLQVLEPSDSEKSDAVNSKSCRNSLYQEDPDDVCLSELKNISTQSNINNVLSNEKSNNLEMVDVQDQLQTVKKRRGRPKAIQAEPSAFSLSQHIEVVDSNSLKTNKTIDDDADDICLSTLKVLTSNQSKSESKEADNGDNINNINKIYPEGKDGTGKDHNDTITTAEDNIECQKATNNEINVNKHTEDTDNQIQISDIEQSNIETNEILSKRSTKMPVMADFEYNIDSVIGTYNVENKSQSNDGTSSAEQTCSRPVRRKTKKLQYEEESDEDPFANVELSDDEPMRSRRGNKYYSDDEYLPGKRGKSAVDSTDTEVSDSNLETELDNIRKQKKKKFGKKSENQSPRKKGRKEEDSVPKISDNISALEPNCDQSIDVEQILESSDKKSADSAYQHLEPQKWGNSTEFENFIAKKIQGTSLKIKKVGSKTSKESNKMEIPVIDPEAKKTIEMFTQTFSVPTLSTGVQTTSPYHVPLKENVPLTPEQSERACYFLNSIVKTTAEVGTLMIQKSQDFIKKKINTNHVTDTAAMDYCVKKSFLLFKLAKHNLRQMEEDLEKQYDEFLKANDLTKCKAEQKKILPTPKENNSDSDCEIVEVLSMPPKVQPTKKPKPEFNPKTVFLNKELSIKIAKKPNENKKLDIKGRHTVWINDTVMLKKVKPTQSFLAQDSRNKKPPDNYVTEKMVNDFFKYYDHQRVLSICAPFVSAEWLNVNQECVCNYFTVKPLKFNDDNHTENNEFTVRISPSNAATLCETSNSLSGIISLGENKNISCPESLFLLCFHTINSQLHYNFNKFQEVTDNCHSDVISELPNEENVPRTLFRLCVENINKTIIKTIKVSLEMNTPDERIHQSTPRVIDCSDHVHYNMSVPTLKSLCYLKLALIFKYVSSDDDTEPLLPLKSLCCKGNVESWQSELKYLTDTSKMTIPKSLCLSLKSLCYKRIVTLLGSTMPESLCLLSSDDDTEPLLPLKSHCCKENVASLQSELKYLTNTSKMTIPKSLCLSLKSLCYKRIVTLLGSPSSCNALAKKDLYSGRTCDPETGRKSVLLNLKKNMMVNTQYQVDSLLSLCLKYVQKRYINAEENNNNILIPKTLQKIAFENVIKLLYTSDLMGAHQYGDQSIIPGLMINCVNTLSEEAFLNLEHCNADTPDSSEYNDFDNEDNFEPDLNGDENVPETSWISKLQMQELRSCTNVNNDVDEQQFRVTQIKVEPDDPADNFLESIPIKKEPIAGPDEMTIIPDVKSEIEEHTPIQRKNSNSYSADEFENFLVSSKIMQPLIEQDLNEIYSQRSERIRMQHEPDDCDVNNTDMLNLLVPHTYETMNIQNAKGSLMESSSDEGNKSAQNKNTTKKIKRTKGKVKKSEQKSKNDIAVPVPVVMKAKEKNTNTEVAILTRRMKEKIRQEEKSDESTDSENENLGVRLRSRDKKDSSDQTKDKPKVTSHTKTMAIATKSGKKSIDISSKAIDSSIQPLAPNTKLQEDNNELTNSSNIVAGSSSKAKNFEIQCNNVDSTEQFEENIANFTGFTTIETNEMSNYEKCLKFVYERVIPQSEDKQVDYKHNIKCNILAKQKKDSNESDKEPIISPDAPIELLQCEPNMPIFEEIIKEKATRRQMQVACPASKKNVSSAVIEDQVRCPYIERHGWHCYPVDSGDAKLYENACVYLEKLPESFVQTYFKYQNIATNKNKSDAEIDRLTNLNTLNRLSTLKDRNSQSNHKRQLKDIKTENITDDYLQTESAMDSDHYEELMPSDEENSKFDNEVPQKVQKQTENTLAKSLLMNDNDSEDDASSKDAKLAVKIKTENNHDTKNHKKKITVKSEENENLMLTADKMMNKELTLLHAPVVLDDKVNEIPTKGPVTRQVKKSATKTTPTNNKRKTEEDSSSEEEKQWVSTKEKLLKKLGKKDSASTDDAKRAKLVSEFIERREGNPDGVVRRYTGKRSRRSAKKFLEREKQLRVLERELFGEMSNDPTVSKTSRPAWKGRRNIRKVLDKKSLARSTVVANMEEFERKKRLNVRQTKLRELLGCEEGVNVLVINDEVCLEYDFVEHRPVVTIHPFFTKVMKAHQYEGVKFMWDACFESLADIEAGRPGGGCILAHCMGLGKTLQVLALLHTVLTHPRVGMRRVLVCCPLSTVLNWVDEIHKWIGPVTNQIKVFELSKLKKTYERAYQLEDWYNGGGIFIIGYELFRSLSTLDPLLDDVRPTIINKIRTALLNPGPDIVVCDEGHLLKNDCSVLAVAMSQVVTKRRIVLTGTPMQNNLREYYCMVNFVKPNLLGTYSEYSNRFENPIMNGQHRDSSEEDIKLMKARTHILHKVLEGCLQRQEASVLYPYLPKKYEYTVFINLTQCQWDLYEHYLNHYSRHLKQNSILKDFHILQKIWSHPQVLHNFQTNTQENKNKIKLEKLEDDLAREDLKEDIKDSVATELWWLQYLDGGNMLESLESSNKFVVVFRILEECVALGDKVLIFSTSLICLNSLEYFLKKINKWSLGQEYYRLDGSVPAEVRQKWCREFNAENNVHTKLFLVSTRAGCLGLNMTAANRVIIMDTSWNPAHDIQSIFRVYRFGQKKDCFIYRLVAMGTMEQKIYERSVTKQAVACRVVDEQQIDRHYNMAELTELYRYDSSGSSVAGGVAVGVRDVALLRVARDAALHAVHEHDSLLRSSEQGLPEHERAAAWMQFQQEQADKQMENTEKQKIPKISLKRVQGQNYAKSINIKRENIDTNSDDFVPPNETKTRRGRKPKVIEVPPTPGPSQINDYSEQITPDLPGPSQEINPYREESMVQKISEILLKHNFHNRKGNTDVLELLANVKKIVKQGYMYPNDSKDVVTASIAQVLLTQKQAMHGINDVTPESAFSSVLPESPVPEPDLSTIIPDSVATTSQPPQANFQQEIIVPDKRRKRKAASQRTEHSASPASSSLEPESILGFSHDDDAVLPESRKKRRAAVAAEKQFDLLSNDVIINLDEYDATDSDFVPDIVERTDKPSKAKRRSNYNETTPQEENKIDKDSSIASRLTFIDSDTEICEETVAKSKPKFNPKPGPKTYKEKVRQTRKETRKEADHVEETPMSIENNDRSTLGGSDVTPAPAVSTVVQSTSSVDDSDERIPLPLSLLTNKNFINIVAHTYLNGNPMLDADAATLAAKYSTLRALKEAEQSGKDIVSGAIYDIAVKVIGKNLFKKMTNMQVDDNERNCSILVEDADVTIHLKDNLHAEEADVTIKLKDKKEVETKHNSKKNPKPKSRTSKEKKSADTNIVTNRTIEKDVISLTAGNQYPSGHVVPVGMIQSAGSLPSGEFTSNESILPHDDDEMLIISSDIPPAREQTNSQLITPTPVQPVAVNANTGNSNTLKSNHSVVTPPSNVPTKPATNIITISKGKIMMHSSVSGSSNQTKQPPTQYLSSETICLDSDDEDSPMPVKTSLIKSYIPVSTRHNSNDTSDVVLAKPSDHTTAGSIQEAAPNPLVIRQVSVGNAPKFILVPAQNFTNNSLPTKVLPNILRKKETITLSSPVTTATQNFTVSYTKPKPSSATNTKPSLIAMSNQTSAAATKQITSKQGLSTKTTTILATTTPSAACLSKLKQARCKPGDIIKISDKGEIEVLQVQKTTKSKSSAKPTVPLSEVMKSISSESINKTSRDSKKILHVNEATDVSNTVKATASITIPSGSSRSQKQSDVEILNVQSPSASSDSSDSRPTSPVDNNPLAILKDVVHIQAADDKTVKNSSSKSVRSNISNVYVKHRLEPKNTAKLVDKNSKDLIINQQNKLKSNPSEVDNKMLKDLLNKKSTKPLAKITNAVKDGLKSIVIDDATTSNKKPIKTIDLVGLGTVKAGSGATMLGTKIEIKKRGSNAESSPIKKIKTGPMTLKDFNIDDIDDLDDIIELE